MQRLLSSFAITLFFFAAGLAQAAEFRTAWGHSPPTFQYLLTTQ